MADLTSLYRKNEKRDTLMQMCSNYMLKYIGEKIEYEEYSFTDVIDINGGTQPPKSQFIFEEKEDYIRFLQIRDFSSDSTLTYIPNSTRNKICSDKDLLIGRYGASVGKILTGKSGAYNVACAKLTLNDKIDRLFMFYWLHSSYFQDHVRGISRSAQGGFNKNDLSRLKIKLPTKDIQLKIGETLRIIDNNILNGGNIEDLKFEDALSKSLFSSFFIAININSTTDSISTEITQQLDMIKNLRQAFLREAMQGLLVSNETSNNKTGADLLAEIQAEKAQLVKDKKIKKSKPLAPITEEEHPFAIPENWTWCRVDDVSTKIGSGSTPKGSNYSEEGYPFFRSQNIKNEGLIFDDIKFISDEVQKQMIGTQVLANDLLLNITGGSLGRCALVPNNFEEGNVSQHVCIIRGIRMLPKFYHFLVLSPYFQTLIFSSTTGAGREGLPKYNLELFTIPLPPLEIQERIVAKLDDLMGYCDALEEQVKQSQKSNELLLQQVLREALGDKKEKKETNVLKIIPKQCNNVEKTILAGYIINQSNTPDFGKVKFQKILHLTEYHCQIDMNSNYSKKVAGPHDTTLINNLVSNLQRYNFYKIDDKNKKHDFIEMSSSNELVEKFNDMFDDQKKSVNQIIELFSNKSWEFCELISTLYAVWNNRIINKEDITNKLLTQDFLKWNESKIKFIDKIDYGIKWIKDHNLEPLGWGNIIE